MSKRIPEGWVEKPLSALAHYHNGRAFKPEDWSSEGLPIIRIAQITNINAEFDHYAGDDVSDKNRIVNGDLLFSWSATLTALIWNRGDAVLNQHIFKVEEKEGIDRKYLHQVILNSIDPLADYSHGSTMKHIKKGVLDEYCVAIPDLPEQQKIAAILSSVDDVIEKTRAQIDKLKDLKMGMMQELLTKGIGHTEFKDSPVGQIPVGWKCKTIDQLADFVTSGSRGWAQYYSEAGSIFIRIGNLTREHINLRFNDIVYVSPPESAEGRRTRVQLGDILISITADLGVIGVVNESIGEAYVNQHISLVRLIDPTIARWIGHFLMFEDTQKQFVESNDAGAKAGLNLSAIRNIVVAIPKQQERDKIVVILDKIDEDVVLKRSKLDRLISIKKALMQDLLTGTVRVNVD